MISYAPLWTTMEEKHATTYTLQVKGEISSSTIRRRIHQHAERPVPDSPV